MNIARWLLGPAEPLRVEYTATPTDVVDAAEARIAQLDAQLAEIAAVPPPVRSDALWSKLDRLIDLRNAIRPGRDS